MLRSQIELRNGTPEGVPKLLDFGIAKVLNVEGGAATATVGAMTLEYARPELALPTERISGVWRRGHGYRDLRAVADGRSSVAADHDRERAGSCRWSPLPVR